MVKQLAQKASAAVNVLDRIKGVFDPQLAGRSIYQLHNPFGSGVRDSQWREI
jgi:hypothetical protein